MFKPSTINLRELQKLLFAVAYKMIGEVAPSEDIAQETIAIYLSKSLKKELSEVIHLKKYLVKTATNRSINYLKKVQKNELNTRVFGYQNLFLTILKILILNWMLIMVLPFY